MTGVRELPVHTLILMSVVSVTFAITCTSETSFYLLVADTQSSAPWRWLTAHLVHTDGRHLTLNLLALFILGVLLESITRRALWAGFLIGCSSIQIWFEVQQDIIYYCGLSGVLCTLLAFVLVTSYEPQHHWGDRTSGNIVIIATGAIILLKLIVEYSSDARLVAGMTWPSAPDAHLVGFLSGVIIAIPCRRLLSNQQPTTQ